MARGIAQGEGSGAVSDPIDEMGPIDYVVIEFPGNRMTGEAFPLLLDLVDRGLIRILDLTFVRKDADGSVAGLEIADLTAEGLGELEVFQGASSGLLGEDDLADAAAVLEPGSSAAVLVYENLWAAPLAVAVRRSGGRLVAGVQGGQHGLDGDPAAGEPGPR